MQSSKTSFGKHSKSSVSDSGVGVYVKVDENEMYCGEAWLCCIVSTEDIKFASFLHA